jgi:hypothetical protein
MSLETDALVRGLLPAPRAEAAAATAHGYDSAGAAATAAAVVAAGHPPLGAACRTAYEPVAAGVAQVAADAACLTSELRACDKARVSDMLRLADLLPAAPVVPCCARTAVL